MREPSRDILQPHEIRYRPEIEHLPPVTNAVSGLFNRRCENKRHVLYPRRVQVAREQKRFAPYIATRFIRLGPRRAAPSS